MPVLEMDRVTIEADSKKLVDGVSFSIEAGEWFALVGESGGGKSITGASIGALLPEALKVTGGEIRLLGMNMRAMGKQEVRKVLGKNISYVFQDYQNAFTPFIRVGKQMDEMIRHHIDLMKNERLNLIYTHLNEVGLDGERIYKSYPFQLSGGQLQRAAIAQAMLLRPELLVADEPTTALDSITTVRILKLIENIKENYKCAVLFITHDLRCVKCYADRVAIIQQGKIVEMGDKNEVLSNPREEYTRNLFASVPPLRNVPGRLPVKDFYNGECKWRSQIQKHKRKHHRQHEHQSCCCR